MLSEGRKFVKELRLLFKNPNTITLSLDIQALCERYNAEKINSNYNDSFWRIDGKTVYLNSETGKFSVR